MAWRVGGGVLKRLFSSFLFSVGCLLWCCVCCVLQVFFFFLGLGVWGFGVSFCLVYMSSLFWVWNVCGTLSIAMCVGGLYMCLLCVFIFAFVCCVRVFHFFVFILCGERRNEDRRSYNPA